MVVAVERSGGHVQFEVVLPGHKTQLAEVRVTCQSEFDIDGASVAIVLHQRPFQHGGGAGIECREQGKDGEENGGNHMSKVGAKRVPERP